MECNITTGEYSSKSLQNYKIHEKCMKMKIFSSYSLDKLMIFRTTLYISIKSIIYFISVFDKDFRGGVHTKNDFLKFLSFKSILKSNKNSIIINYFSNETLQ